MKDLNNKVELKVIKQFSNHPSSNIHLQKLKKTPLKSV